MSINQVIHGDCLDVMPTLDMKFDMILCDLPYGTTVCKWDTIIPFEPLWEQYKRLIKNNGVIVLTGSEPFSSNLRLSNINWYAYDWIWDKGKGGNWFNLKNRPFKSHEDVMVFFEKPGITFNPERVYRSERSQKKDPIGPVKARQQGARPIHHYGATTKTERVMASDGKKHPMDIVKFPQQEKGYLKFKHPTKKPVALFEYLIKTYTNEGETVLDNCAGSGTTAIACLNTNRNYILIEKYKKYVDMINERISEHEQQASLFGGDHV